MADKKVIAVLGATGAQGGGLARAILADESGEFTVRALTRKVDSDKAKALADSGAEVVAADLDDYESLKKAFAGAYGVFAVTNFWEHFRRKRKLHRQVLLLKQRRKQMCSIQSGLHWKIHVSGSRLMITGCPHLAVNIRFPTLILKVKPISIL